MSILRMCISIYIWASLMAQRLKHLPGMRETQVQSLGREDPLEKEMATHSSTLAWRIPWREEPGGLQSTGSQRVGHDWATSLTHIYMCVCVCLSVCLSVNNRKTIKIYTKILRNSQFGVMRLLVIFIFSLVLIYLFPNIYNKYILCV